MNDTDKVMNPWHFGRDPADIRINLAIWIWILDHLWLKFWHWRRFVSTVLLSMLLLMAALL